MRAQIRQWGWWAGFLLALAATPSFAQNRRNQQSAPRPNVQQRQERREQNRESRPPRNESRPPRSENPRESGRFNGETARPQFQPAPQPPQHSYPQYQPPAQGHHSGQWLNQHRQQPLDQQRRALEGDPQFRRLPRETQRDYEQRLQRFDSLPPDRQHQVLHRMETWEHLTPQQKRDFIGMRDQFNGLSPDRRRAVHNAIDTLRAMPPEARQRELESGRFSQFSPQEKQILNGASRLPLAPAAPGAAQPEDNSSGPSRYVPRPPH